MNELSGCKAEKRNQMDSAGLLGINSIASKATRVERVHPVVHIPRLDDASVSILGATR